MVTDPGMTDTLTIIFAEGYTKTATHMPTRVHAHSKLHPDMQIYKLSRQPHLRVQTRYDTAIIPQRQTRYASSSVHTAAPHLDQRYCWLNIPFVHAERHSWQHLHEAL